MNGIRLLVLISFFSQVALAQNPQPNSGERDYGWQRSPEDGVLEYIVQLSPETVALMQSTNQENASDMPPQLVGRATRTVVRIGTSILPRTPSLDEIARTPRFNTPADLNAALNDGRFSDLESNAVVNVQGGTGLPPLPGLGQASNSLSDLKDNVIDNAARAASALQGAGQAGSQLGSQFLNGASGGVPSNRDLMSGGLPGTGGVGPGLAGSQAANSGYGNMATPSTGLPSTGLPSTGFPGTGLPGTGVNNTGKFKETAPDPRGYPGTGAATGNPGGIASRGLDDSLGTQNWQGASNRTADNRGLPGFPSDANAGSGQWSGNPSDPMSLNYDNQGGARPSTGFGVPPGGQYPGRSLADAIGQNGNYNENLAGTGYPNGNYAGGGYPQTLNPNPRGNPSGNFAGTGANGGGQNAGVDLIASNPNGNLLGAGSGDAAGKSPGDVKSEAAKGKASRSTENFLQVFFLLSLVVNFYLAMLIRKLLTRYRSLLSSVRSQTA